VKEVQSDIFAIARRKLIPLDAMLEVTYRCNLSCVHCFIEEDTHEELATREIFDLLDQLAAAGTMTVTFTGGEALMREDFFDIAAYARHKAMAVNLMSNGTLIDDAAAREMQRLHFSSICLSLYGTTDATHEAVTRRRGSFAMISKALEVLRQYNLPVDIKTPVLNINFSEFSDVHYLCRDLGLQYNAYPFLSPTTRGSRGPLQYRLDDLELTRFHQWEMVRGKKPRGYDGMCNAGFNMVCISAHGKVYPCNALRLEAGNIRQKSFGAIWRFSSRLGWLRNLQMADFEECSRCELIRICERCPGEALAEEGCLTAAPRERCRMAKIRKGERNEQEYSGKTGQETLH
jgi:radical SAM protein with 4Fe4S-binding SPASM domain